MYNSYSYQAEAPADEYEDEEEYEVKKQGQLSCWGNAQSMNLNPLILTNITGSPYFKVQLFNIKTYHEVIDEIYYKVDHLEPWERGSRSTSGQTGMCGGVRGVGAGGIVSSAYCLLYKLYTLKLTKKQVNGLLVHCDSPFIRGLGFMYIRYTQPPTDLLSWFEEYLDDEEEIDPKAGGGKPMTIGEMAKSMLVRLEWFDTRFPRIPVNVQKQINASLDQRRNPGNGSRYDAPDKYSQNFNDRNQDYSKSGSSESKRRDDFERNEGSYSRDRRSRSRDRISKSKEEKHRNRRTRSRSRSKDRRTKDRHREDREKGHKHHRRSRSRSRDNHRSHRRHKDNSHDDFADELKRYSEHRKKSHKKRRSRSRSRERR